MVKRKMIIRRQSGLIVVEFCHRGALSSPVFPSRLGRSGSAAVAHQLQLILFNSATFITRNSSCREEAVVERSLPDYHHSSSTVRKSCFHNDLMGRVCGYYEWDNYKNLFRIIPYFLSKQGVIYLRLKGTSKTGSVNHTVRGLVSPCVSRKETQSLAQM